MPLFDTWIDAYKIYKEVRQFRKGLVPQGKATSAPSIVYDTPSTSMMGYSPGRSPRVLAQYGYVGNPVVYRAINIIADECGSIPLKVKTKGGTGKILENSPLLFLLSQPNLDKSKAAYIQQMVSYWLIAGTSYTYLATGRTPQPQALYQLRPDLVEVMATEQGITEYKYTTGRTVTHYTPEEVRPLRFFHPLDELYGLSPITVASIVIDRQNEGEQWNASFMKHAARPSGAFTMQGMLGEEEYQRLKSEIMQKYVGKNNAGTPLLLEGGLQYVQTGNSPLDADWNASDANAGRKIAMAIGVDPLLLNDKEHSTYNNIREARIALADTTVHPMMTHIIDEWNGWLAPRYGTDIEIFMDERYFDRMRDDINATSVRMQNEFTKGIMSFNTAQMLAGREAQSWGDFYQMGPQTYVQSKDMQEFLDQQHERRMAPPVLAPPGAPLLPDGGKPPLQLLPGGKNPPAPKDKVASKGWAMLMPTKVTEIAPARQTYAEQIEAMRSAWDTRFQAAMEMHFADEHSTIQQALVGVKTLQQAHSVIDSVLSSTVNNLASIFLKFYTNIGEDASRFVSEPLHVKSTLYRKSALSDLSQYAAQHIIGIDATTRNTVEEVFTQAYQQKSTMEDLQGYLDQVYTQFPTTRGINIARTEVTASSNLGMYLTACDIASTHGITIEKTWVAIDDEYTRDTHGEAGNETIDLLEYFLLDGSEMLFPGDTSRDARPKERINCRCCCQYTVSLKFNNTHDHLGRFGTAIQAGDYAAVHAQIQAGQGVLFSRALPKTPTIKKFHEPFKTDVISEEECLNSERVLGSLLDKDNSTESAGATKKRISEVLASELKGDVPYQQLVTELSDRASYERGDTADVKVTSYLVHKWAETSADNDEMSVAIQDAAIKAFKLTNTTMKGIPTDLTTPDGYNAYLGTPGLQSFVKAQYNVTQKFFKDNNITSVIAYRGMSWASKPPGGSASYEHSNGSYITIKTRPLNPYSVTLDTATSFTGYGQEHSPKMMVIATRIPVSRIVGSAQTGVGCKEESEIVVLGGKDTVFAYKSKEYMNLYPTNITEYMQAATLAGKSMKSDEIYYIDEDPYNADWTKQSWDLPVSNIQELRQWLEESGKTVEDFIKLPVYQLNKHKFIWLATLEDASQKFNPNHTRSGQFGTHTGGYTSLKAAEDGLQKAYSGLTADFKGCDLGLINEALPDFKKVMDHYSASSRLQFLGTGLGKTPPGFAAKQSDVGSSFAATGKAQGKGGSTGNYGLNYAITLSAKKWGDANMMHEHLAKIGEAKWSAVAHPTSAYVLVHEMGHVVTLDMMYEPNYLAFTPHASGHNVGQGIGMVKDTINYWTTIHKTALIGSSGYAKEGYEQSGTAHEPIAEAFTGSFYHNPKKIFKQYKAMEDVIIPDGSEKAWTNVYGDNNAAGMTQGQVIAALKIANNEEIWFEWTEETGQFPDEQEQKFNSVHDRRGMFGTRVGVAAGQIEDAGSMSYFSEKDQGKINAYASANGISSEYGISATTKLIEASKTSGHYEADADWYNRAGEASNALAKMTGITSEQSAGIIAAMSPRNRWDRMSKDGMVTKPNIKDAITIAKLYKENPIVTVTPEIAAKLKPYDKSSGGLSGKVGMSKPLNDYTPAEASYLSMGHITGYAVNTAKSFRILRGEPVGKVLGGPKVRSFYNNIHNPSEHSSVTIDTWMVRILTGKDKASPQELSALLSRPNSGGTRGIGSYPLYADMLKSVAKKYNIAPHAVQAVAWEQARREVGQGVTVDSTKGWENIWMN